MNIIGNSCISSFLTRDCLKEPFNNPFCWCVIDFDSIFYIIKNYYNINWLNFELVKDENWNFSIIIDKNIKVQYVHYVFDKNVKTIEFKNLHDVCSNHIWEYIIEKYNQRINRMLKSKEEPIFILGSPWTTYKAENVITREMYTKIKEINTNFKIYVCSDYNFTNEKNIINIDISKIKKNDYYSSLNVAKLIQSYL